MRPSGVGVQTDSIASGIVVAFGMVVAAMTVDSNRRVPGGMPTLELIPESTAREMGSENAGEDQDSSNVNAVPNSHGSLTMLSLQSSFL